MHDCDLFDLDSIKNIIPLLKNNVMTIQEIDEFLPDELVEDGNLDVDKMKSLVDNDLLPFLIHSGMRSKLEIKAAKQEMNKAKTALSHVQDELQHVVDKLPEALAVELPEARRMPTPGTEKIDAAAKRWLEKLMFIRWRQQDDYYGFWTGYGDQSSRAAVRGMIQIPPTYRHG